MSLSVTATPPQPPVLASDTPPADMSRLLADFIYLHNPSADSIASTPEGWLAQLSKPACVFFLGQDPTRTRMVTTLLHGNEPSGTIALHRYITDPKRAKPATNILCIIASVHAAQIAPAFSHRIVPNARDLNRCFRPPFDIDQQGKLAQHILQLIDHIKPEAVVDIHNTSGSGPAFAVVTFEDHKHDALTSWFTQRMIITNIALGALMEISDQQVPTVTIECGGRLDDEAHNTAFDGLQRFFNAQQVLTPQHADWDLERLHNPVRLEIQSGCLLSYATASSQPATAQPTITLKPDVEHLNFGVSKAHTHLGWTNSEDIHQLFHAQTAQGCCVVDELVYIKQGSLYTAQDLKLFMFTTNADIAKMDCLFYAVQADGQEIVTLSDMQNRSQQHKNFS